MIFTYKLVFGLTDLNVSDFFQFGSDAKSRGHAYKLFSSRLQFNYKAQLLTHRSARTWNTLPDQRTVLTFLAQHLSEISGSLSSNILARYCKMYFL